MISDTLLQSSTGKCCSMFVYFKIILHILSLNRDDISFDFFRKNSKFLILMGREKRKNKIDRWC